VTIVRKIVRFVCIYVRKYYVVLHHCNLFTQFSNTSKLSQSTTDRHTQTVSYIKIHTTESKTNQLHAFSQSRSIINFTDCCYEKLQRKRNGQNRTTNATMQMQKQIQYRNVKTTGVFSMHI